jgi:hypothetical protein
MLILTHGSRFIIQSQLRILGLFVTAVIAVSVLRVLHCYKALPSRTSDT